MWRFADSCIAPTSTLSKFVPTNEVCLSSKLLEMKSFDVNIVDDLRREPLLGGLKEFTSHNSVLEYFCVKESVH